MDGIVSLLDDRHRDLVVELWDELRTTFGLRGIYATRFPHFSYHVAEAYEAAALGPVLQEFGQAHSPFVVRATGLGVFTGPQPVIYTPVVRSPELARVHQNLWVAVDGTARGTLKLYHSRTWVPHITLAHGDITNELLPEVMGFLCKRDLAWEININNVTLVLHAGSADERQMPFWLGDG